MLHLRHSTTIARHGGGVVDDDDNDDLFSHDGHSPGPFDDGAEQSLSVPSRLSFSEKKNLVFLCILYFVHAIPLQFSWLTMPILLRQQLTYSDVGTFLVSQYPYSWKVAWGPLVDGFHIPFLGRRKTWIVPSLLGAGGALLWLAFDQDALVAQVASGRSFAMAWIVLAWLAVMVFCANIRIALDSWAIDLISAPNVHWVSPITTFGETMSGLISFNIFLGVASLNTAKDAAGKTEPASTRVFFAGSASVLVVTSVLLLIGRRESGKGERTRTVRGAYNIIWRILKLRHVWLLMFVHMASMIGFITNDTITILQLVKNNFDDFQLAGLGTAAGPFALAGGFFIAKTFQTRHPLEVWRKMFPWRLLVAFISQLTVLFISWYPDSSFRWFVVFVPFCLSRFFESAMWIAFVAFHAQLSDPQYGGIYMSLLSTTLNIRYDTFQFLFTKLIGMIDGSEDLTKPSPLIDGYQIVNTTAVILAIFIYRFSLKPATKYLETLDISVWRVGDGNIDNPAEYEMVETREETI
ncbi:major facilitator superfamily domain-containing protein [Xylariales sp. PMI_506]|nr:major facilitator superfamily domain-containing protein [Xylariales sp. PMI_506]